MNCVQRSGGLYGKSTVFVLTTSRVWRDSECRDWQSFRSEGSEGEGKFQLCKIGCWNEVDDDGLTCKCVVTEASCSHANQDWPTEMDLKPVLEIIFYILDCDQRIISLFLKLLKWVNFLISPFASVHLLISSYVINSHLPSFSILAMLSSLFKC